MRTKWYLLGCFSSIIILILLIILGVTQIAKLSKTKIEPRVSEDSVLHMNLSGLFEDYSVITDRNFSFFPDTAHDIILKITSAKEDSRIKAIILEPQGIQADYALLNEMIDAFKDFKTSGKKVYGYITMATQKDIYLLSIADAVYMNPSASAGFILHGVGGTIDFYKDMLDKIGIEIHVIKAGDYKAAGEPFTRNSMSPEFRKNITLIYDDIYNRLLNDLSSNYGATNAQLKNVIERSNRLIINQEKGKEIKIVDDLIFFDQFLKMINTSESKLLKYDKYEPIPPKQQYNRVAVLYALGSITPTKPQFGENNINSKQVIKTLEKLERDSNIKAIVIRINSGGGSALESEIIYNKIAQVREKKPVVVSMGGVAASGGYYIATPANFIFADPYTITGSIGVFSMIPDLSKTAQKIGIKSELVGHGKYLSTFSFWDMYNEDTEQAFQAMVNDVYHEFKTRVSDARKIDYADVESIAQGQVWSAQRAKQYKLIDEIGSLTDAINKAASIASISNYSISYFPERKTFFNVFIEENLNFPMMKLLLTKNLPEYLSQPSEDFINLYEDVQQHPIQMRLEYDIKK
ncbi:MAG: signal peptide peptidase SppA [Candidatus Cloacimonetes bacterium]|nr:signal peptide peptidase SppA [Candidatus Cloacimonadota bacterium]